MGSIAHSLASARTCMYGSVVKSGMAGGRNGPSGCWPAAPWSVAASAAMPISVGSIMLPPTTVRMVLWRHSSATTRGSPSLSFLITTREVAAVFVRANQQQQQQQQQQQPQSQSKQQRRRQREQRQLQEPERKVESAAK